ncbi:hypothetical protein ACFQPG_05760 [Sphingomonas sp. GCM10030256]|uniref:hypothetical protein n=1 Tax=Sphingomonas sp. GCM10030256 TaxID=3273427 RepID=UPI00360DEDD5
MRLPILLTCALLLGACRDDQAANVATADGAVVSEGLRGNDVTAIDAATNDSANMAADVEFTMNEADLLNELDETNTAESNTAR